MGEYIVSARKYRPNSFDTVVGQSALTTTLKNAVKSGKLAHAYLFCGPRGVGKTTCARIFAKAINCATPTAEGEACDTCESCQAFNEQRSYNIFELDAASHNSVEDIKNLMEQTRIPPQIGRYKVFIIDEVHMLSTAAFNAFLKTLEEPPAHVIFILATTEKNKILPTILSRCQIYDFERMTVPNTIAHLKGVAEKEGIQYEEEALSIIAEKADGGMRDALSIFDQAASFCQGNITYKKVIEDLNVLDSEYYFHIVDLCMDNKVSETMSLLNDILNKGFDGGNMINGLAKHVRNVMMAKDASTLSLLETSESVKQKYTEQAKKCTDKFLYGALKIMNRCDINYRQSSNKRLLVELTLIEMAQITQPDEDSPGAGRRPKRLKSLFKQIIVNNPSATVQQVTATDQGAQRQAQQAQQPQTTSVPTPQPHTPVNVSAYNSFNKPNIRFGTSFSALRNRGKAAETAKEQAVVVVETEPFTQEELSFQWMRLCNCMPQQYIAVASRMKNLMPRITELPHIEVIVDNQDMLSNINKLQMKIRSTLQQSLHNGQITITVRLARAEEIKKIPSRAEQLANMSEDYPALGKLREQLGLELA